MKTETRQCQNCKHDFQIEPEDFSFYEKIKVPPPTFCPDCRAQRRMSWRNEHNLFKRNEDKDGKVIFSAYPNHSPVKIYEKEYWWSDAWSGLDYGKEYDFSRSFFEQFHELMLLVPFPSRSGSNQINSEYSNNAGGLKNCYLCFNCNDAEDCSYGIQFNQMKKCLNMSECSTSEQCSNIFAMTDSYRTHNSENSASLIDSYYCFDCRHSSNIVGCVGLRNKNYCIFNKQFTKEEYQEELKKLNLGSYETHKKIIGIVEDLKKVYPRKYMHTMKSTDVSGDYVFGSKNVKSSFMCYKVEDAKYVQQSRHSNDLFDCTVVTINASNAYESSVCGLDNSNLKFSFECHPSCLDITYSIFCTSSSHLFGCVGLIKKEYCIFNRQYTKEEYNELVPKIIKHMANMPYTDKRGNVYRYGEFFPQDFCPFAYNETIAHEYFPLTEEEAVAKGFTWYSVEDRKIIPTITTDKIPDHIKDIPDYFSNEIIECDHKGKCNHNCSLAFKAIPSEISFYKEMNVVFPRSCPNCRHYDRIKDKNSLTLWHRQCMCEKSGHEHEGTCPNSFETSYPPTRPELIYCEACYQKEVL